MLPKFLISVNSLDQCALLEFFFSVWTFFCQKNKRCAWRFGSLRSKPRPAIFYRMWYWKLILSSVYAHIWSFITSHQYYTESMLDGKFGLGSSYWRFQICRLQPSDNIISLDNQWYQKPQADHVFQLVQILLLVVSILKPLAGHPKEAKRHEHHDASLLVGSFIWWNEIG